MLVFLSSIPAAHLNKEEENHLLSTAPDLHTCHCHATCTHIACTTHMHACTGTHRDTHHSQTHEHTTQTQPICMHEYMNAHMYTQVHTGTHRHTHDHIWDDAHPAFAFVKSFSFCVNTVKHVFFLSHHC